MLYTMCIIDFTLYYYHLVIVIVLIFSISWDYFVPGIMLSVLPKLIYLILMWVFEIQLLFPIWPTKDGKDYGGA